MELSEYLGILRKRWLSIAVLAVLGGILGYAWTAGDTPLYRSTSTVYLTTSLGNTVSDLNQGAAYTSNLMQTYAIVATTPVVLEPVIEKLGLDTSPKALAKSIQAQVPLNSYLIDISVTSSDPTRAADISNAVATQLGNAVRDLAPTSSGGSAALKMTQVAAATPASAPFAPRPKMTAGLGLAGGLALGIVIALVRSLVDTKIRTAQDLPDSPARVALGQVPGAGRKHRVPALIGEPHGPLAEAYRRIRTNLQFVDASRPLRAFVITSALPGEGKSTTSINLALVMAESGARVLLVDADLRSPSIADLCGIEGAAGLSAVLIHEATLDEVVQPWHVEGLDVVTAGQVPPNPSQLVESAAMDDFLRLAQERYDLVIVDTAPLLAVADAAALARRTDGALVVARARKVRRPDLAEALASLDTIGASVLGIIVNGVSGTRSELRYGYGQPAPRRRFRRLTAAQRRRGAAHQRATPRGPRPNLPLEAETLVIEGEAGPVNPSVERPEGSALVADGPSRHAHALPDGDEDTDLTEATPEPLGEPEAPGGRDMPEPLEASEPPEASDELDVSGALDATDDEDVDEVGSDVGGRAAPTRSWAER